MTEAQVTKECCKYLKKKGIWYARYNAGHSGYVKTRKGLPDHVVCHNGRFIGLEFKSSVGKLRPEQEDVGQEIKDAGGVYLVVRSVEDLKKGLKQ